MPQALEPLRKRIFEIDEELVGLLRERVRLALEIGRIKAELGVPVFDPEREKEVMLNAIRIPHAPLDSRSLEDLFGRILAICRDAQAGTAAPPIKE